VTLAYEPPPGYTATKGKRGPRDGSKWFVVLRTGFCTEPRSYTADQLDWVHKHSATDAGSGDVIAVKRDT